MAFEAVGLLPGYNICGSRSDSCAGIGVTATRFLKSSILWQFLNHDIERVVDAIDSIWILLGWRTLYGFDEDDLTIQNYNSPPGMEYYGIDSSQVTIDKDQMGWECINTSGNPGHLFSSGGLIRSVQWLNYWSLEAQKRLFKVSVQELEDLVSIMNLKRGAVRVRLGKCPGRFDDEAFHQLQLECRRRLHFHVVQ